MQNLLRKALNFGLLGTLSLLSINSQAQTEKQKARHRWLQPDLKYVEKRTFALGASYGMTDLWADVGTKDILPHYLNSNYWNNMKGMGSFFVKYTHTPGFAMRIGIGNGTLYATDLWNKSEADNAKSIYDDPVQRYYRNLNVKTNIWEGSFMFEISPFQLFSNWEFGKAAHRRFQPYLLAGVGGIYFNPRGELVDFETQQRQWIDLRPLATEGQNFDKNGMPALYSRYALVVPAGVGFRVDLSPTIAVGMEYVQRYAFTDYLDDASGKYIDPLLFDIAYLNEGPKSSQARRMADKTAELLPGTVHAPGEMRGDPNTKDMYSTISVNLYWNLFKRAKPWW
ncbi:MAG TPA: hypothetical protein PKX92_01985 [Edaphocola sp.]|nr:hypothetical protein [Edaphocola sp.]